VGSWEDWVETGVMKASDELHRIFGLDPVRDRVTKTGEFPKLFYPEDRERVADAMTNLVKNRIPIDIDFRIVLKDGTLKYIHEHAQIKKDSEGRDVIFGTAQDITEQKKAEEERKALETQLRRTQRLETIGTLAGGIAHDFNNILTPILGYADMAMISVPEEHPVRADLEHVIKAAHRAKELVQQILTFSRQGDQEKRPLEIHLIVKEVLELMRASLPSSIEIKQNVDPACGCVLADPSQIHQVLMNLCTNAFHAMRDGGGTLEISLRIDTEFARVHPNMQEQRYLKLSVRDTGSGMSKSVIDRIFEPFFTTKGVGEGTGLGLSVVHGIITNHGGDITVESELGKGTTFNVYLPQAKHATSTTPANSASLTGGTEHILFVDDEEEITLMVKQMLETLGYRITIRNSSVDALKLFSASPREFDMVICDQTMPYLAGNELASELLAIRPDIPVLMMTGYSESFSPDDARRLGIRQYLTKPIAASDLNAAIRKQLGIPNLNEV
jgi:PAS domain S-box-containing protein